ncbi:Hypothetical protein HVR_LOCUS798 [uncultured virus]|nr:Hypothetical protein HVR_LOCUS798 [uncultured virus]
MATLLSNPASLVEYGRLKFVIFDAPNDDNIKLYLSELKKHRVTHVIRVCHPTYSKDVFTSQGISFSDWPFPDGSVPPEYIIQNLLELLKSNPPVIGIHCVAGLGRAPLLVAIALIEEGMDPHKVVNFIRERRPRCINKQQLNFITQYKSSKNGCIIC